MRLAIRELANRYRYNCNFIILLPCPPPLAEFLLILLLLPRLQINVYLLPLLYRHALVLILASCSTALLKRQVIARRRVALSY
jgi:hypothetical protein